MNSHTNRNRSSRTSSRPRESFLGEYGLPAPPPPRIQPRPPEKALPEERYAIEEGRRQALVLKVESAVLALGELTTTQLSQLTQRKGLENVLYAQRLNDKASDLLDPVYLDKFQTFSNHSLEASLRGLLQIQYLGVDIVLDIVQESPNLRIVPPEKMGIIKTIFSNMFLKGR